VSGPLVFAHRGASAELPEHTLKAYLRAIDQGADGLECDVRLTRDGHLVCIHDSRLDRTSNGRGRVSYATLNQLEQLDFESWHTPLGSVAPETTHTGVLAIGPGAPETAPAGVLTLNRLIETVLEAGRPLRMLIETKHPTRYGGSVEIRLVDLLRRYGLTEADPSRAVQVTVMSFSPLALRRVHELAPDLPTVFLFELVPPGVRDGRPPFGARLLGPGVGVVRARPEIVSRAHGRGHQVYVWTVNEAVDIDVLVSLGVDGIITDRPAFVLHRLHR
jgi:glycerophosphoryl diester phosphodiesterase